MKKIAIIFFVFLFIYGCGNPVDPPYVFNQNVYGTYYGEIGLRKVDTLSHHVTNYYGKGFTLILNNNVDFRFPNLPQKTLICDLYEGDSAIISKKRLTAYSKNVYKGKSVYIEEDFKFTTDTTIYYSTLLEGGDSITVTLGYLYKEDSYYFHYFGKRVKN